MTASTGYLSSVRFGAYPLCCRYKYEREGHLPYFNDFIRTLSKGTHGFGISCFVFLAGFYDHRYPQTTWAGIRRKLLLNVLLGIGLKIPMLYSPHDDISWLVLNLAVYRAVSFPLYMLTESRVLSGHR